MDSDSANLVAMTGDLASIRARLAARGGPALWRGLDELAGDDEFFRKLGDEFAPGAAEWDDAASRRNFLKLMGASLALAGMVGCNDQPQETIVPYVNPPEQVVPGRPTFYATAMPFSGYALGALAESHEGRPTKIEGNPAHSASLGASNVFMQASVLDLYDPDRSKLVTHGDMSTSWGAFYSAMSAHLASRRKDGAGVRLLTRSITSPSLAIQIDEFLKRYPGAQWHVHDPTRRAGCCGRNGGGPGQAVYDFSKADVILSLDADFMFYDVGSLAYARQFMDGRRRKPGTDADRQNMNRLYVIESSFSLTGTMADHRKAVKPSQIEPIAQALASRLGVADAGKPSFSSEMEQWLDAVAADLKAPLDDLRSVGLKAANGGVAVVVAADHHSPALQALAFAMNQALGSIGKAVRYIEPVEKQGAGTIESLASDMAAGKVDTLLIVGGNPAYDAPADVQFQNVLRKLSNARDAAGNSANFTAHLASHKDETSFECQWHIPESHYLEAWGDLRAYDGTPSIIQPLILPLSSASRSAWEFMAAALGQPDQGGYEIVRAHWQPFWKKQQDAHKEQKKPEREFQVWWESVLREGIIVGFAPSPGVPGEGNALQDLKEPACESTGNSTAFSAGPSQPASAPNPDAWEIVFRLDMCVWDGQYANNPWLMELPRPFTKLVWENAALMSYRSAEKLGVTEQSLIKVAYAGRALELPVLIVPGQADEVLTLHLGFGRTQAGHVADDPDGKIRGYNAYFLQTAASPGMGIGVQISKAAGNGNLVMTRSHHAMAALPGMKVPSESGRLKPRAIEHPGMDDQEIGVLNRKLVRTATLEQFQDDANWVTRLGGDTEMKARGLSDEKLFKGRKIQLSLYPDKDHGGWDYSKGYQWAMSIDQTACIGCNACVVACQAENNIPVVGKDECGRQREMQWIRIDDWYGTQPNEPRIDGVDAVDEPQITHQPVPCMHCENAPCELVCPVGATTHSAEGLNEMTYNRCIGTRYCSNNCPYKVRRFNFFLFADFETPSRALQYNPDVTVRSRGVMEKCTYCVQRLNETRMDIEKMTVGLEDRARAAEGDGTPAGAAEAKRIRALIPSSQTDLLGQLQTACQQSCPTQAIVFGDKNQPNSPIAKVREDQLSYGLLEDLTTKPRTTYLGRLSNPNRKLSKAGVSA